MALGPLERQVGPAGAARLALADPTAFGANVGAAISELGASRERYDQVKRQLDRNEQSAALQVQLEGIKAETEKYETAWKAGELPEALPGGAGHNAQVTQHFAERAQQLLDGVQDPQLRQQLQLSIGRYGADVDARSMAWEAGARIRKMSDDVRESRSLAANRVAASADPALLADALDERRAMIEGMAAPDDVKAGLLREDVTAIKSAHMFGMVDRDPALAKALLDKGVYDDLDPDRLRVARNAIGVEERRQAQEAETALRLAKADAKTQVDGYLQKGRDGVPLTREEIAKASALIGQFDLKSDGYDVAKIVTENDVRQTFRASTPAQISQALASVEGKIAANKGAPVTKDYWIRDQLQSLLTTRREQIDNDPSIWAAQNGQPAPTLDLNDSRSIAAVVAWGDKVAQGTGRPARYLTRDQAEEMAARYAGGPRARMEVAGELARFPARAALSVARQVAPNDPLLGRAAMLGGNVRSMIANGQDALKANPALVPTKEVQESFQRDTAAALKGFNGDLAAGTLEAAKAIYANMAAQQGFTEFQQGMWWKAVHLALGASHVGGQQRGGIGQWKGRAVLLPGNYSQRAFEEDLSRLGAGRRDIGARWGNGEPMTAEQLRSGFFPVAIGARTYRFEDAQGNVVRNARGQIFSIDFNAGGR